MESEAEALQKKHNFYLCKLRALAKPLSQEIRQRISDELLARLAHSLLNETVFAIVHGLMEIQHVTEAQLEQQRMAVTKQLRFEKAKVVQESKGQADRQLKVKNLEQSHSEALRQQDMSILNQFDHKVADQQCTLELAGVPGFYVTTNPVDIQAQMHLLDFILQLSVLKPD
ncbi:gonadal protein gdl [Neocloeon triangulifer]|uniref:gonadal protein gdl n=1 Tax=Neocloeon triangulifer TaxID=2078957 RepID=UPI00286F6BE2|nr:gonadal protein gdl [Neocloeon triangulifer]